MNKQMISCLSVFTLVLLGAQSVVFAAGGGSFSAPTNTAPQKTPQQLAVASYNLGIKARDKAHEFEAEMVAVETDRQRKKLQKKAAKQYKRAAKHYKTAIKHEPRLYQAHGSLGYALKQMGDFEAAMTAYDAALELKPEYTPAIEYRAEAYLELARYDEVIEAHSQLKYRDRGHQKELENAIADWLQTHNRSQDNAAFHDWATQLMSDG